MTIEEKLLVLETAIAATQVTPEDADTWIATAGAEKARADENAQAARPVRHAGPRSEARAGALQTVLGFGPKARCIMSLLTLLLVALFFVCALLGLMWLGKRFGSPLMQRIAQVAVGIAIVLAVVALLIWGLDYFGVLRTLSSVHVPVPRR
jgi:hypothetical protein